MSGKHPIIAVTGSSGAGTSSVKDAFEIICDHENIKAVFIEGDSYHRYGREEMDQVVKTAAQQGKNITHFGPEGNLFDELNELFFEYAQHGTGKYRYYIHNDAKAELHGSPSGTMTPWQNLPEDTDLLFYEGLHGAVVTDTVDICRHVDLLIGVTPIINLEWIQKIHRDREIRGYSAEDATALILSRMYDYVHYITPQFSRTDINFQRIPTIDTSNPFAEFDIPTSEESLVVIHIRNQEKIKVDFQELLKILSGAFMTTPNTMVIPAGKMIFAMQLIITPTIQSLMRNKDADDREQQSSEQSD